MIEDIDKQDITNLCRYLLSLSMLSRREGLLALEERASELKEDLINDNSEPERNLLFQTLQLVIDGTDHEIIKTIFTNRTQYIDSILEVIKARIMREGILGIQAGDNPRIMTYMMDSVIPDEFREKNLIQKLLEED